VSPKRRWYQFRLRNLLLLITLLCLIPGGFVAYHRNRARRQELAVRTIEEVFLGDIRYDESAPPRSFVMTWLLGDDKYSHVKSVDFFWNLKHLDDLENGLSEPVFAANLKRKGAHRVTDDDLRHLEGMTELRHLRLDGMNITDAGLARLGRLTQLRGLTLGGTQLTDRGLAHLRNLTELDFLNLGDTKIGDEGLAHLAGLTKMQQLHLTNTQVTDGGIAHLKGLAALQLLDLEGTQVTEAAAKRMRDSVPGVMVVRD